VTGSTSASEPPDRWIARIVELRRQGRDDEADAEVRKLRARYPELAVPDAAARRESGRAIPDGRQD
jgi:hypothetical protein